MSSSKRQSSRGQEIRGAFLAEVAMKRRPRGAWGLLGPGREGRSQGAESEHCPVLEGGKRCDRAGGTWAAHGAGPGGPYRGAQLGGCNLGPCAWSPPAPACSASSHCQPPADQASVPHPQGSWAPARAPSLAPRRGSELPEQVAASLSAARKPASCEQRFAGSPAGDTLTQGPPGSAIATSPPGLRRF